MVKAALKSVVIGLAAFGLALGFRSPPLAAQSLAPSNPVTTPGQVTQTPPPAEQKPAEPFVAPLQRTRPQVPKLDPRLSAKPTTKTPVAGKRPAVAKTDLKGKQAPVAGTQGKVQPKAKVVQTMPPKTKGTSAQAPVQPPVPSSTPPAKPKTTAAGRSAATGPQ